jgi:hypothetical protein
MISARQLANSYLARLADDVIQLAEDREEMIKDGRLGSGSNWGARVQAGISFEALIVARTFWADMYNNGR